MAEGQAAMVDFIDTPEEVERVFKMQRKLSFTYAAIFFAITLTIPLLSITSEWWYAKPIWGGFTLNYLFVALLYHVIYFGMGWAYALQANALEDRVLGEEARMARGEGVAAGD